MQKIGEFVYMMKRFGAEVPTKDAFALAKEIVVASGIVKALREEDDPESAERIDNIDELLNGVQEFCEEEEAEYSENSEKSDKPFRTLDEFLQQVLLYTSEDKDKDKDADKVSLMTIHAAKGLEFPYVFVVGMEEQIFPSFLAMSRPELEEERRLFYVAVTRAEKQVTLSYARGRCRGPSSMPGNRFRILRILGVLKIFKSPARPPFPTIRPRLAPSCPA